MASSIGLRVFLPSLSLVAVVYPRAGRGDGVLGAEACGRCETVRSGCPSRSRAADEPTEAFARHQLAHQPRPLINRDAPVDASGYVRGDVSATDALLSFC